MQRPTFIYKLWQCVEAFWHKSLNSCSWLWGTQDQMFASRSCWKQSLLSSTQAGQMMTEGGPILSVLSWIQLYLANSQKVGDNATWTLLPCWEYVETTRLNHKFIKKKIVSSPDNNVACIYYLFTCAAYCIKHSWDLEKYIKIKAVQQGKIEWGAFVLRLSTKQWLQMWKRPEMLGFLDRVQFVANILGVFGMLCWHLCNRTSLQTLIVVRFLIVALRTMWFDVFLMQGRFYQDIDGYYGLISGFWIMDLPGELDCHLSLPPKNVIRNTF